MARHHEESRKFHFAGLSNSLPVAFSQMLTWPKLRADDLSRTTRPRSLAAKGSAIAGARPRLDSVDLLRGLVMALMALDHTRDFFTVSGWNPRDVTDPALFLTRWITHFCAPTFMLLAGLAAHLYGARGRSVAEISRFLVTRGFLLILIEFTLVRVGWTFSFSFDQLSAGVIWAIGASMIALAALVYLPRIAIAAVALGLIAGHNLLDGIRAEDLGSVSWVWHLLHQPGLVRLGNGASIFVLYPLVPWIGVMAAGYALGPVMELDAASRHRWLLGLGAAITAGFVLLRATNLYGDPAPWTMQETWSATALSFLNCEKYPPSLLFLMMTLGPAVTLLAVFENVHGRFAQWLTTFGRVPLFFYVTHIYLIHGLALAFALVTYPHLAPSGFVSPDETGVALGLPSVYVIWLFVLILLYPLCRWFAQLKQSHAERWWSYL
jgi:uncharacterized membrane protein